MLKFRNLQQLMFLAVSMLFSVQALGILHLKPWSGLHRRNINFQNCFGHNVYKCCVGKFN